MKFLAEIREGLGISWDAIRANKMRSALATLGIVIGIVTVTLMGAAINGLNQAFINSISSLGADVFHVARYNWMFNFSYDDWIKMQRRRPPIRLKDAEALAKQLTLAAAVAPKMRRLGTGEIQNPERQPRPDHRHHGCLSANQRRERGRRPVFDRRGCRRRAAGLRHRQRRGHQPVSRRIPPWQAHQNCEPVLSSRRRAGKTGEQHVGIEPDDNRVIIPIREFLADHLERAAD